MKTSLSKLPASSLPALLLLSTAVAIASAEQPSSNTPSDTPTTTLKVQVREVVLPVTVRDKKGAIVPNLKREDFTLEDDSRPQSIKSFSHETNLPFRLGLLVDTSRSTQNALPGEKSASGKFIDQMLSQTTDKAFLLHFDHEVELLQDFTSSKNRLHHELDDMGPSANSGEPGGGGHDRDQDHGGDSGGDSGGHGMRGGGTQMYDAIFLASNELMLKEQGRKALIVLSDGVDRNSKKSMNEAIDAAEKANVSVYTVYFKGEEGHDGGGFSPGGGGRHGGMGGGGGGGYPGGGGGGYPGGGGGGGGGGRRGGQGEAKVDGKKILQQIADRTGGRFFEAKKKDSFDEVYAQIGDELHGQYLMTYTPDKPGTDDPDGFHKVSLKAKDPEFVVVTREGYYSPD